VFHCSKAVTLKLYASRPKSPKHTHAWTKVSKQFTANSIQSTNNIKLLNIMPQNSTNCNWQKLGCPLLWLSLFRSSISELSQSPEKLEKENIPLPRHVAMSSHLSLLCFSFLWRSSVGNFHRSLLWSCS
jgi:hypothetical protein